jgi:23S rRNA pseudouridine2457 synthase
VFDYYIAYKPYQTLSQFSPVKGKKNLKDYFSVSPDVYSVGRLDYDTEGLLILTNDPSLNHRLLNPRFAHEREYLVQVEGTMEKKYLVRMESGLTISIDGKPYRTMPCKASLLYSDPQVPERHPPIRYRKNIPTSWIRLVLNEGKNRQVRKMTALLGFPALRLIRWRIEGITLGKMQPGDLVKLSQEEMHNGLFKRNGAGEQLFRS